MTIIRMETERVQTLTRNMDRLAEELFESAAAAERGLRGASWQGGSHDEIVRDMAACRQRLQDLAEEVQLLASAGRREMEQWQEAAARFEFSGGATGGWRPGWMTGAGLIGLGGLGGGSIIGSASGIAGSGVPVSAGEQEAINFYQMGVKDYSYEQLLEESKALQAEIADLQRQLKGLPSLESLDGDLAANEAQQAALRAKIDELDARLVELNEKWRLEDDKANSLWNKLLPSKEGGWDSEDGLPWRTRSDDYEDARAAAMAEINDVCQQRANLTEELAQLEGQHDQLSVTRRKVEGLQQDLQYHQENKVFVDQQVIAKAPPKALRQGVNAAVPGAYDVPLVNQRAVKYQGYQGDYACTPTSLSMVTEYYHKVDASNQVATPLDLIKMQEPDAEGYSMTSGSSPVSFADDMSEIGYSVTTTPGHSIADLKIKLEDGPVVALGRMHGGNHAFVVTGAEDGKISMADPWEGVNRTFTEQQFEGLWAAMDNGKHWLVDVRPN
jgi:uncharacterized protein YvpB